MTLEGDFVEEVSFMISGGLSCRPPNHCSLSDLVEFSQKLPTFQTTLLNFVLNATRTDRILCLSV